MIYFDNAATGGKKPETVLAAVSASLVQCANPGRSGHKLSVACAEQVFMTRKLLSDYFSGYGAERVAFTKNCTEALNIAIFSALKNGGHAVTTCLEHNSVLRPLFALKSVGADVDVIPLDEDGNVALDALKRAVRRDTKAVIVTSASNVTGTAPDLKKIRALIPEKALFIVDGAQGAGHLDLDMRGAGIDALAIAGHKGMLGIQGSGALLFSERFSPEPFLFGGTGSESFNLSMPAFYPDRLESGTLNYPAVLSLFEGTHYLIAHGAEMKKRVLALSGALYEGLNGLDGVRLFSKPNECGILSFAHEISSETLATRLSEGFSIAVRGGLHCAPLCHKALGTDKNGLLRVSLSHYNTASEINTFLRALKTL